MPLTYSINDLERLTGIKAHTIRIWERRYGLLAPIRTETNIRTYNDEDLRKILNVSTLLKDGWKISHISELSSQDLEAQVWSTANAGKSLESAYEIYTQALISATLSFDEEWYDNVFTDVTSRFGLSIAMQAVIGPFMERIGLMWTVLKMHPGQEHFASNLLKRKLFTAIDRLPRAKPKGKYLLFLPPWEEHEIGLIYAWYLLRSAGYDVIYLGQRVPLEALVQSIQSTRPQSLLTFMVTEEHGEIMTQFMKALRGYLNDETLYVAARPAVLADMTLPADFRILKSPQDLLDIL